MTKATVHVILEGSDRWQRWYQSRLDQRHSQKKPEDMLRTQLNYLLSELSCRAHIKFHDTQ